MTLRNFILLIAVFTLSACWHSKVNVYDADDYAIPVRGDLISVSDSFGPLGLYSINAENQYVPEYTQAEPNSIEHRFRALNIGFVPIDRMASYREPNEGWQENPTFSRSIFKDETTLLFTIAVELANEPGQGYFASYVNGQTLGICSELLQDGKGEHANFEELTALQGAEHAFTKKAGVAMLVLAEVTSAKGKGALDCETYAIDTHNISARAKLLADIRRGDELRRADKERRDAEMVAFATEKAEQRVAKESAKADVATTQRPAAPDASPRQQLAVLDQKIGELQRELYEINNEVDGEMWGTVDNIGPKYYGVERRFRDQGLLLRTKMLCHNLSGYESIFLTVTHDSKAGGNVGWVKAGDKIRVRFETDNGTTQHSARLNVVGNTQYTNRFELIFSDMIPSRLDNKYVQDPALLARTRRQAELFGTSVEALTRMGYDFISMQDALSMQKIRLYADIRQNGQVRTVFLGDFGTESEAKGFSGFHDACQFSR